MHNHKGAPCSCVNTFMTHLVEDKKFEGILECTSPVKFEIDIAYYEAEKIYTLNPDKPVCKAVKVINGHFAECFNESEWNSYKAANYDNVEKNLKTFQGYIYPGFYECHMHPLVDGILDPHVDLKDCINVNGMKEVLANRLVKQIQDSSEDQYILVGYNVDPLAEDIQSDDSWSTMLDEVVDMAKSTANTDSPVYVIVEHNSMHIWYVNTNMLNKIKQNFPDLPPSSLPENDGKEMGIVQEDAGINALIQTLGKMGVSLSEKDLEDAARLIGQKAQSQGCTTIADAMLGAIPGDFHAYKTVTGESLENFPVRLIAHPFYDSDFSNTVLRGGKVKLSINNRMHLGAIKLVCDGSLQGGTAYKPPYTKAGFEKYFVGDQDGVTNLNFEQLTNALMDYRNYQVMIHANGEGAIDITIDALKEIYGETNRELRNRIEHCQIPNNEQLDKIKALGIHPNFLVNHVYYWGRIYQEELLPPKTAHNVSPVKSAYDKGLEPCLHSDAYVSPLCPLRLIWTAVTRRYRGKDGEPTEEVLNASEKVTVEQALKGITINAAKINHEEKIKGSIEVGKMADMTILSEDIFEESVVNDYHKMTSGELVTGTIVGGSYLKKSIV